MFLQWDRKVINISKIIYYIASIESKVISNSTDKSTKSKNIEKNLNYFVKILLILTLIFEFKPININIKIKIKVTF